MAGYLVLLCSVKFFIWHRCRSSCPDSCRFGRHCIRGVSSLSSGPGSPRIKHLQAGLARLEEAVSVSRPFLSDRPQGIRF
ncbi:hypothetical protein F4782DRAFT_509037 [Xylaria castorea]|nr:hypothetical protein F4782DRAFT_509037 [Xylaria castorea]